MSAAAAAAASSPFPLTPAAQRGPLDLVVAAGGDVAYPDNWIDQDFAQAGSRLFSSVAPYVREADLAFVNLESPLTRAPISLKKTYPIRTSPERLEWLLGGGFNLFSLANNHIYDSGRRGLLDTLDLLESSSRAGQAFWWAGAARKQDEAWRPLVFRPPGKDLKVAFLAFGSAGTPLVPSPHGPRAMQAVREASEQADLVIVSAHTGREYQHVPSQRKADLFRSFVEAGADVVLGHHPHVIQGVESYQGGIIFHSLGNFSFASKTVRHHKTGAKLYGMLPLIEVRGGQVQRAAIIPLYVNNAERWRLGKKVVEPRPCVPQVVEGAFAQEILQSLQKWTHALPGVSPQARRSFQVRRGHAMVRVGQKEAGGRNQEEGSAERAPKETGN
ncbi:MAG: CapA family protein [Acidobacteriota bacterium]